MSLLGYTEKLATYDRNTFLPPNWQNYSTFNAVRSQQMPGFDVRQSLGDIYRDRNIFSGNVNAALALRQAQARQKRFGLYLPAPASNTTNLPVRYSSPNVLAKPVSNMLQFKPPRQFNISQPSLMQFLLGSMAVSSVLPSFDEQYKIKSLSDWRG